MNDVGQRPTGDHGESPARRRWLVVTWFHPKQVGFLDFKYRVQAMVEHLGAEVVTNLPLATGELGVAQEKVTCIPMARGGYRGVRAYVDGVKRRYASNPPTDVLLLHSALAPFVTAFKDCRTVLYWNEHPTHLYPSLRGGAKRRLKSVANAVFRQLAYRGAREADVVMPIGEFQEEDLLAHGCEKQRTKLVYMGVSDEFAAPAQDSADTAERTGALRVLYTGTVMKERGRDLMLGALATLRAQDLNVSLTIVGADDVEKQYCEAFAERNGIAANLKVHGRVGGAAMPEILRNHDIGLCLWEDRPYWRFNPPTKLFEYLVAGLPVVANDMRTHTLYVQDGRNGAICQYSSIEVAEAIKRAGVCVAGRSGMRSEIATRASIFRWAAIEKKFLKIVSP